MRFPYRPSTQKLIAVASLSAALLCSFHAVPAFAETADTSAVNAPVVTTETTAAAEILLLQQLKTLSLTHLQRQQQLQQQTRHLLFQQRILRQPLSLLDGDKKTANSTITKKMEHLSQASGLKMILAGTM